MINERLLSFHNRSPNRESTFYHNVIVKQHNNSVPLHCVPLKDISNHSRMHNLEISRIFRSILDLNKSGYAHHILRNELNRELDFKIAKRTQTGRIIYADIYNRFFGQNYSNYNISRTTMRLYINFGLFGIMNINDQLEIMCMVAIEKDYVDDFKMRWLLELPLDNSKFHLYVKQEIHSSKTLMKGLRKSYKQIALEFNSENIHVVPDINELFTQKIVHGEGISRLSEKQVALDKLTDDFYQHKQIIDKSFKNHRLELTY